MLAANGISFFPYPSRYAVRYEGESPYTAMDFARQIKKRPLAELLYAAIAPMRFWKSTMVSARTVSL